MYSDIYTFRYIWCTCIIYSCDVYYAVGIYVFTCVFDLVTVAVTPLPGYADSIKHYQ